MARRLDWWFVAAVGMVTVYCSSDSADDPPIVVPPNDAGFSTAPVDSGVPEFDTSITCPAGLNILLDTSFDAVPITGFAGLTGRWSGDVAETSIGQAGVSPRTGSRMARFVATDELEGSSELVASQLIQVVSASAYAASIAAGEARVDACAWFNRVATSTDSQFRVYVRGYQGTVDTIPQQFIDGTEVFGAEDSVAAIFESDGDPSTWEQACVSTPLTPGGGVPDFLTIEVSAGENNVNDPEIPEFMGHFVDDACLAVVVEPR